MGQKHPKTKQNRFGRFHNQNTTPNQFQTVFVQCLGVWHWLEQSSSFGFQTQIFIRNPNNLTTEPLWSVPNLNMFGFRTLTVSSNPLYNDTILLRRFVTKSFTTRRTGVTCPSFTENSFTNVRNAIESSRTFFSSKITSRAICPTINDNSCGEFTE